MQSLIGLLALASVAFAQLSGSVGPTTSLASKQSKKTCNVLSYGAKADNATDLGPPLASAWNACKSGGVVVIPTGNYAMATWATLDDGNGVALQLDGTVYRTGTAGGTMLVVENTSDFEMFSSTGKGAIQGFGYVFHREGSLTGPRLVRFDSVRDFSAHDFALADAPSFHMVLDTCANAEIYNVAIRGGDSGGLDGIDLWGTNIWVHDVMVTNKDECVTVKSPSSGILVEQVYCNWSGGSAIGSLGADTAISNVQYDKVYSVNCNQMMMIKSNGGSGYARSMSFTDFIGHGNAYSLNIDQDWSGQSTAPGSGVQLSDITFGAWTGDCANGLQRGPMQFKCAAAVPCTSMGVEGFAVWTDTGSSETYLCENAYGSGGCLRSGSGGAYTATQTVSSPPGGWQAPRMPDDVTTSFGFTSPIPIPQIPSSFFPGTSPLKPLA